MEQHGGAPETAAQAGTKTEGPVRIGGEWFDIAPAARGFMHYSPETRATMRASHRMGFRQRQSIGEAFWTHPLCPGVCFRTRAEALRAALRKIAQAGAT